MTAPTAPTAPTPLLLAAPYSPDVVGFRSLVATQKIDGIRVLIRDGRIMYRSGIAVNHPLVGQAMAGYPDSDWEIYLASGYPDSHYSSERPLQETQRWLLGGGEAPPNTVPAGLLIDYLELDRTYADRMVYAARAEIFRPMQSPMWLHRPSLQMVSSERQIREHMHAMCSLGHEGLVLRHPDGMYIDGRSSVGGAEMIKAKPVDDTDCTIRYHYMGVQYGRSRLRSISVEDADGHPHTVAAGIHPSWTPLDLPIGTMVTIRHNGWLPSGHMRHPRIHVLRPDLGCPPLQSTPRSC